MSHQIQFKPKRKNSKKIGCCTLAGSLDIAQVLSSKELFTEALENYKILEITFEEVDDMDLAFFQLLYALEKSAKAKSKEVVYKGELPSETLHLFTHAGIDLKRAFLGVEA